MKRMAVFTTTLDLASLANFAMAAADQLPGVYDGKLSESDGYPGGKGDPFVVTIGKKEIYGGSMTFGIDNVDPILFETRTVDKQLQPGQRTVKLVSPGRSEQDVEIEIVFMKLGAGGKPVFLKMMRTKPQKHTQKSIACGNLVGK